MGEKIKPPDREGLLAPAGPPRARACRPGGPEAQNPRPLAGILAPRIPRPVGPGSSGVWEGGGFPGSTDSTFWSFYRMRNYEKKVEAGTRGFPLIHRSIRSKRNPL